jgi:hypothetical protein
MAMVVVLADDDATMAIYGSIDVHACKVLCWRFFLSGLLLLVPLAREIPLGSVWMFVLAGLALHSVEYHCPEIFALRSMSIFMFGCVDIWYLELISYLNTKTCLDGQSDVLHLKRISCVTSNMFENNSVRICSNVIYSNE